MGIELRGLAFIAAAATLACERPAGRTTRRDTSARAASDTIVRTVVRAPRHASAMQRVTGILSPRRALEPLDSILAIRVLDQRGAEIGGVPVRWTLANAGEGAELHPMNGRTDALGLSRVRFTPGRSASGQGPVAEVASVGRIDFAVAVAVSSIEVIADKPELWPGEDVTGTAALKDDAGNALAGGRLAWRSTDSTVLRVVPIDSLHARITGVGAGSAGVQGWIGATHGTAYITVRPVVSGRFLTIGGRPAPLMLMEIRSGPPPTPPRVDTISVENSTGRFSKRVELQPEAQVEMRAGPIDESLYHSIHMTFASQRELQDLRIALVPTSWSIDAGTYKARIIAIDAARAMRRGGGGAPFWRLAPISGSGPRKILGWRESELPLRIAFDRGRSDEAVTSGDSVAFWTIAAQMQRDLGATVFVPADMHGDTSRTNFAHIEITSQATDGHTFVSWGQSGDAYDGVVLFRHSATLHDPHVVTHELLHLLGFGHSTSWTTVARPMGGTEPRLTPEDVAYVQLAMRLRRVQEQTGARPGLPIANQ